MFSPDGTLISASAAPHCAADIKETVFVFFLKQFPEYLLQVSFSETNIKETVSEKKTP